MRCCSVYIGSWNQSGMKGCDGMARVTITRSLGEVESVPKSVLIDDTKRLYFTGSFVLPGKPSTITFVYSDEEDE